MAKRDSRKLITSWHKKLGIISAAFLIFLSLTGVLLNHAHQLKLDANDVGAPFILELYGIEMPEVSAVQLPQNWLSSQEGILYFGYEKLAKCSGDLVGAVPLQDFWIAVCSAELQLYTYSNQLIERVGVLHGLPQPIERAGVCHDAFCLDTGAAVLKLDVEALAWSELEVAEGIVDWSEVMQPPLHVLSQVQRHRHGGEITWERVVMDLHAGRFLGPLGPLFMDLMALLFIVLAVTGLVLWSKKGRKSNRQRTRNRHKVM